MRVLAVDQDTGRELGPDEVGEVCVGPVTEGPFAYVYSPMLGYWGKADESARALRGGLLHTGDIGMVDADGLLTIKDRKNDMIIRGGANVYPAEVERVLVQDRRVTSSAVLGIPDTRLGEAVVAAVQLAPGAEVTEDELRELCATELRGTRCPSGSSSSTSSPHRDGQGAPPPAPHPLHELTRRGTELASKWRDYSPTLTPVRGWGGDGVGDADAAAPPSSEQG